METAKEIQYSRTDKRDVNMEKEVSEIKADVKEVRDALLGNNMLADGGLIGQLRDLKVEFALYKREVREKFLEQEKTYVEKFSEQEKKIQELEDFKKKILIYIGVGMVVCTFIGYFITMILNMFHPSPIILK